MNALNINGMNVITDPDCPPDSTYSIMGRNIFSSYRSPEETGDRIEMVGYFMWDYLVTKGGVAYKIFPLSFNSLGQHGYEEGELVMLKLNGDRWEVSRP